MTATIIAIIAGLVGGYILRQSLGGPGKQISASLQVEIQKKEQELQSLKLKEIELQGSLKSREAEAKAQAKEILSTAKIDAQNLSRELEKQEARGIVIQNVQGFVP